LIRAVPLESPSSPPSFGFETVSTSDRVELSNDKSIHKPEETSNPTSATLPPEAFQEAFQVTHPDEEVQSENSKPELAAEASFRPGFQAINSSSSSSIALVDSYWPKTTDMPYHRRSVKEDETPISPKRNMLALQKSRSASISSQTELSAMIDVDISDDGRRATYEELIKYPPIPPTFISPAMEFPPDKCEVSVIHRFPTKRTVRRWALYLASPEISRDTAPSPRHPNEDYIQESSKAHQARVKANPRVQKLASSTLSTAKVLLGATKVTKSKGKGRGSRSRGCKTCRDRKLKCDEVRPKCGNCSRGWKSWACVWEHHDGEMLLGADSSSP
jgi:hypothetical protein